ncbi:pheromone-binding protein-related protein 6-like [Trichogramma pretiosum]|uniref:Odorant-binding protein 7 n=1 Tax=Trichogramma dendrolimi TaxID=114056 RepID=A0A2S0BG93_9HYME|nr:pheromone-binding protein-related protein 6-like [Trichogramma pretiosum]ANG08497.1 odorant-binding protein 7 [Trichogramma dendrolimi]
MKSERFLFLLVVLCARGSESAEPPKEIKVLLEIVREKCHRETGVDIEHVEKTMDGYFHDSEVLGCYFSCVFNSFDLLDHEGHMDFDKMLTKLSAVQSFTHAPEIVAACRHITGPNPCRSALNIMQCFHKANPDRYFLI